MKKVINDNNTLVLSAAKLTHYYTKEEMDKLLDIKSDFDHEHEDYATKDYVNNIVSGGEIDFTDYAKKSYVDAMDENKADKAHMHDQYSLVNHEHNYISEIPEEYITEEELSIRGYVTRDQALETFVQRSELPSLDGYATESWVLEQIDDIPDMDLSDYATKDYVNNIVAGGELDLSNYATISYVDSELTNKAELYHTHSQYSLNTHTHDDLIAKDAELQQAIDQEITNRTEAVANEQARAEAAEQLTANNLVQEILDRQEADADLLEIINTKSNMADVYTKEEIDYLRDNKRVVYLTCEEFNALPDEDRVLEDVVYILTDMEELYASKEYVDNKDDILQANIDAIIVDMNTKANADNVYTKEEIDANTQATNTSFTELEEALDAIILAAEQGQDVPTESEPESEPETDEPSSEGGDN